MEAHVPQHEDPRIVRRRERVDRFVRPIQVFMATETAGGMVLLAAAFLALAWANSPWDQAYRDLLHYEFSVDVGIWALSAPLHFWVNDALMVIFFFVVGLEIKRETAIGELSNPRRVIVPIAAAFGGMLVPAVIFLAVVNGGEGGRGWGIPIATDIAFAIGVLTVVGGRVPFGLKVMLLALAIVDDIGGILVIALFYTSDLALTPLIVAVGTVGAALAFRQSGIWYLPLYFALGVVGWAATVESGIHPTIIGVTFGLLAPWRAWYHESGFAEMAEEEISRFREAVSSPDVEYAQEQKVSALMALNRLTRKSVAPLDLLEREWQPIVAFVIVPIFAFSNAGVSLSADTLSGALTSPVALGVFAGLLLGKPIGIVAATWVAVRMGAELPAGVNWRAVLGIGLLGGIGFTVSLLITELSFSEAHLLTDAKIGIIFASAFAGLAGFLLLRTVYGGSAGTHR